MNQIYTIPDSAIDLDLEGIRINSYVNYDNCSEDCLRFCYFLRSYLLIEHPFEVLFWSLLCPFDIMSFR